MPTIYKRSAVTTLNTNTAWDLTGSGGAGPAGPPAAGDTAYWQTGSLGASLTGSFSPQGIQVDGALTAIAHSSGTITLGSGGFTFGSSNTKPWTETGVIAVGSVSQTWLLSRAGDFSLSLNAVGSLTGSSTITLANNSGVNAFNNAFIGVGGLTTGFTGTIELGAYVGLAVNAALVLTTSNITVTGAGCMIWTGVTGQTLGAAGKKLTINNDVSLGQGSGRTFTIASDVELSATSRTLSVDTGATTILSGAITGTAGFTKAGSGTLTIPRVDNTGLTGDVSVTAGSIVAGTNTVTSPGYSGLSNISSLNISGIGVFVEVSNTLTTTGTGTNLITYPVTIESGSIFYAGAYTQAGTDYQSLTGEISGAGTLQLRAGFLSLPGVPRIIRARSISLPDNLHFATNGDSTSARSAHYEWAGGASNTGTNIRLDVSGTVNGTNANAFYLYNVSSGEVSFGNVTKATISTSQTAANFTIGGASDLGDISITGVVSGTDSGALSIVKTGPRKLTLSGANTYTGTTSVSAGTLSARSITMQFAPIP